MMAVWAGSGGALLLVVLTGASYSFPANKGLDASSAYGSSRSASAGRSWKGPYSGFIESGVRSAAAKTALKPVCTLTASHKVPKFSQPDVQTAPIPAEDTYPAPDRARYPSRPSAQDIDWLVAPPRRVPPEERPGARRFASTKPEALGSRHVAPPAPPPFQAGELSHAETSYEKGNYQSETEERGVPPAPPPGVAVADGPVTNNNKLKPAPGRGRGAYPHPISYMSLMGRIPPGTLTHSRSSFEKGRDSWRDTHTARYYNHGFNK